MRGHCAKPPAPQMAQVQHSAHLQMQVKPYYFDFLCSVKNRWKGMTVVDVLSSVSGEVLHQESTACHEHLHAGQTCSLQCAMPHAHVQPSRHGISLSPSASPCLAVSPEACHGSRNLALPVPQQPRL